MVVIKTGGAGQVLGMGDATLGAVGEAALTALVAAKGDGGDAPATIAPSDRIRAVVAEHHAFIWRSLRRLGLAPDAAEDAAQQVFITASRKLTGIRPGGERAYLFGIALRVAADARRATSRRREQVWEEIDEPVDPSPGLEEQLDERRARAMLDEALERLPMDLRVILILHELEELTMKEIAQILGIAAGTVASRLRRARQDFEEIVTELSRASQPRGPAPELRGRTQR
jgi:RNA polymerase sigma-70 factor (ECF subfamily)